MTLEAISARTKEMNEGNIQAAYGQVASEEDAEGLGPEPEDGDLMTELEESLSENRESDRIFYCHSMHPVAPNPGLKIDGIGSIGLPLSSRDAKLILPHESGVKEIESSKFSFTNPEWGTFVARLGSSVTSEALGIAQHSSKPRCEFHKLLLLPPGSQLPSLASTIQGAFASVIVVLPSPFEGGGIHVSHAKRRQTFSTSKAETFDTSVLSWYVNVVHETQPIISGYLLALSYNLVHMSTRVPPPSLPGVTNHFDSIRRVLRKWNSNEYSNIPSLPVIALLLQKKLVDLPILGIDALSGADLNKVQYILPLAKECGFVVCLGDLICTLVGEAEAYGTPIRWDSDSDDDPDERDDSEHIPEFMEDVDSRTYEISNLVRMSEGARLQCIPFELMDEDEGALIPQHPFDFTPPDTRSYEPLARELEHCYERSVLVLFREEDEIDIVVRINGLGWAAQELESRTNRPQKLAAEILIKLEDTDCILPVVSDCEYRSAVLALLKHAVVEKDVSLWNKAMRYGSHVASSFGDVLKRAVESFELGSIVPGLSDLVAQTTGLREQCGIVRAIETHLQDPENLVSGWIDGLIKKASSPSVSKTVRDIPCLVWISQKRGFGSVQDIFDDIAKQKVVLKERFDIVKTIQDQLGEGVVALWVESLIEEVISSNTSQVSVADIPTLIWIGEKKGLESVRTILNNIVKQKPRLEGRFEIIKLIEEVGNKSFMSGWIIELVQDALSSYENPTVEDIPAFLWISEQKGLACIRETSGIQRRVKVVQTIEDTFGGKDLSSWVSDWIEVIVSSLGFPSIEDIPALIWIARKAGLGFIQKALLRRVPRCPESYDFLVTFVKTLHENRHRLSHTAFAPRLSAPEPTVEVSEAARQCIMAAISLWTAVISTCWTRLSYASQLKPPPPDPNLSKISHVCELIELCFTVANDLGPCTNLLNAVIQAQCDAETIKAVCVPLVPRIKHILAKYKTPITLDPFGSFFRDTIARYLVHVVGAFPGDPPVFARSIGCGQCSECATLDAFLQSTETNLSFRILLALRNHVEQRILAGRVSHLISYETVRDRTPHKLSINKLPVVVAKYTWKDRQSAALDFVRSVGDDATLEKIMKGRLGDVMNAIHGMKPFVMDAPDTMPATGTMQVNAGPFAASVSTDSGLAGVKRKR